VICDYGASAYVHVFGGSEGFMETVNPQMLADASDTTPHTHTHAHTQTHPATLPPLVYCIAPAVSSTQAVRHKGKTAKKGISSKLQGETAHIREQNIRS